MLVVNSSPLRALIFPLLLTVSLLMFAAADEFDNYEDLAEMIEAQRGVNDLMEFVLTAKTTTGVHGQQYHTNVTFTAIAKEDTHFYPAYTPLSGMYADFFEFPSDENPTVPRYTGIQAYRDFAKFEAIPMRKGQETWVEIDLNTYYELEPAQLYTVQFSYGLLHRSNLVTVVTGSPAAVAEEEKENNTGRHDNLRRLSMGKKNNKKISKMSMKGGGKKNKKSKMSKKGKTKKKKILK